MTQPDLPTELSRAAPYQKPLFALTMQYIAEKLVIKGLRVKQFYWDDTGLVGTSKAISEALEVARSLSAETDLNLQWKQCHLYGRPE